MIAKTNEGLTNKLNKIIKLTFTINIITQIFYLGYLIYSITSGKGILIANIILLSVSAIYLIFFIINESKEGKDAKEAKAKNKKFKKWGKRFVKIYTLGIALYSMYFNIVEFGMEDFNVLSFISTILMVMLWFYQVYLDLLLWFIKRQIEKIKNKISTATRNLKEKVSKKKEISTIEE